VEKAVWSKRYDLINDFEEMLTQNDTTIQKSLRPSREARLCHDYCGQSLIVSHGWFME
jgi:hypothetical protein